MTKENGLVIASLILGGAIVTSTLISKGIILEKQPKENIVSTTVGHVNLGKVYAESRAVDVTITNPAEKDKAPLVKITNADPDDFTNLLQGQLQDMADMINKQNKNGDTLTFANLSGKVKLKVETKTHVNYRAENIPMYDLIIDSDTFELDINQPVYQRVSEHVKNVIKQSQKQFDQSMFIKD